MPPLSDVQDPHAIAYRVRGDSMVPRYNQGDEVIVSPNSDDIKRTRNSVFNVGPQPLLVP